MAPLKILIVGAGIAGPTLATFLLLSPLPASQKPLITILERSSSIRMQGQNIDIRGAGKTIIRKLGLEGVIEASTTGELGVQHVDKDNTVWAAVPATGGRSPTSDIEILRGRLAEICWKRNEFVSEQVVREGGRGVEYVFGDHLDNLEQDGDSVRVHFAKSGDTRSFDIVVGADGLQSRTRSMAWGKEGEEARLKRLGMFGAFFSMPKGPTDTMWRRWYHAPGRRGIMLRPDQQGGKTTAFVTVINEKDSRLVEVARRGPEAVEAQKQLVAEYFRDAGWESDRVIQEMMATKDFYYDIIGQVHMDRWSKGGVVLLGDAGYCASPLSGMGTTLALVGAYNLAGCLLRYPDDCARAFLEYEEKMRPTVKDAQKLAPGMPYILSPETEWGIWIMKTLLGFLGWTRIGALLFMFLGPPADIVPVEEYGFKQLPEWSD